MTWLDSFRGTSQRQLGQFGHGVSFWCLDWVLPQRLRTSIGSYTESTYLYSVESTMESYELVRTHPYLKRRLRQTLIFHWISSYYRALSLEECLMHMTDLAQHSLGIHENFVLGTFHISQVNFSVPLTSEPQVLTSTNRGKAIGNSSRTRGILSEVGHGLPSGPLSLQAKVAHTLRILATHDRLYFRAGRNLIGLCTIPSTRPRILHLFSVVSKMRVWKG